MPKESTKATITSFAGTPLVRVVDGSNSRNISPANLVAESGAQTALDGRYVVVVQAPTGTAATDTAAIQAALTAVGTATAGEVVLSAGEYQVNSPLLVPSSCVFRGRGRGVSTVKLAAGNYSASAKSSLILNANYASAADNDTAVDTDITICDMTLDGNQANVTAATESEGVDLVNVHRFAVRNCEIKDVVHDGVDLDRCASGIVEGNRITDCGWNGVHAGYASGKGNYEIDVVGNYVSGCAEDRVGFDSQYAGIHNDSRNGKVINNTVVGCWRGILVSYVGASGQIVANNNVTGTKTAYDISVSDSYARVVGNYCSSSGAGSTGNIQVSTGGQGVLVEGNTLTHNNRNVAVDCANPCTVNANTCRGTSIWRAIEVGGGAHVVANNSVGSRPSSSARGAIEVLSTAPGSVVTGNRIFATTAVGRAILSDADDVVITGNTMNGTPAVYIEVTGDDNIVTGNRGDAATTAGLFIDTTADYTRHNDNNFRGCASGVSDTGTNTSTGTNVA